MRKDDLLHNLPWLPLGPTEEVMRRIEQHITTNRGDFYSVYGPSGCGKTRFLKELSLRLECHDNIVARDIIAGQGSIFAQVAKMLDTTEDETEILKRLEEVPPTGMKMVLLVDDAEKLTQEELSFLYAAKEKINKGGRHKKAHLVIVLFMDLNNQDIFLKELLLHSNSFTIGPINHMQVSQLVTHIYQFHGKEPQYSSSDLRQLHAFSYGYPGRVVRLIAPDLEPVFEFKKRHAFYAFLLIALVGGLIYFGLKYEQILTYFDVIEPQEELVSEITISSQVTPIYYPAINQVIDKAIEEYSSLPQGIVIIQGGSSETDKEEVKTDSGSPNGIEFISESESESP